MSLLEDEIGQHAIYSNSSELGLSVLMVEARDRVGGRTYTVDSDGEHIKMLLLVC